MNVDAENKEFSNLLVDAEAGEGDGSGSGQESWKGSG